MVCPNCIKESLVELSVCPNCGIEIQRIKNSNRTQKNALKSPIKSTSGSTLPEPKKPGLSGPLPPIELKPSPTYIETKPRNTSEIVTKNTNRTLVDFQPKKTSKSKSEKEPEWRLQLRNAVKKRLNENANEVGSQPVLAENVESRNKSTNTEREREKISTATSRDELVARAMERIENSRRRYLVAGDSQYRAKPGKTPRKSNNEEDIALAPVEEKERNPKRVTRISEARSASKKKESLDPDSGKHQSIIESFYDTNELNPKFVEARVSTSFDRKPIERKQAPEKPATKAKSEQTVKTKNIIEKENSAKEVEEKPTSEAVAEESIVEEAVEFDDIAPFGMRFNSGLFDLLIGAFISILLLSPFILLGGNWLSTAGFFGFITILCGVMFVYLTVAIALFGKSIGMSLFSLELIDIGGEEYPTFHQSAVNSSIYLLSLALLGTGFLPVLFDSDRRAIHDLVSGTIMIREE